MSSLEELKAYTLIEKRELKEVKGVGYILSHNKTKARVMVICNDDNNKVFNIGFRTPPMDDCGTPHIMEHSVLCGSKNFPVKDPFVELCKGSLNTFLNAMTYPDKTVYPVASLNKTDFHNLMHVYLDAVFYPNIYDREEIMQQEGWHYELDEESGELIYNGVVYNEMKGVYSSAEEQLYRVIQKALLPDTAYSYESGGDPDYITDLTREAFLDFHKRYYHPSNSYIYLYGDMDAYSELDFIDKNYLADFDYLEIDSSLKPQAPFDKPVRVVSEYSLAEADDEKDNTYLSYNVIIGDATDEEQCLASAILEYALLSAPGAPLKKALIDAGIGKDVYSSYDNSLLQTTFSIIAKNANEEDEERFIEIIEDTMKQIIDNGFNDKSLAAAINYFEFKHKEANFGRYPKGLMLGLSALGEWLYDTKNPLSSFELNPVYESIKSKAGSGYFEKLLEERILLNNHKAMVVLKPKKGLNEEKERLLATKLVEYKKTLSEAELLDVKKKAEHLEEYQSEPSNKEELMTIPLLEISDIDKKARRINNSFSEIEQVKVISHDIFTNGISYVDYIFDVSDIDCDKYPLVGLLTEIFKYVDTENYKYSELANEINIHTGGIGFSTSIISGKEKQSYTAQFLICTKQFDDKIDKSMELLQEILFNTKLDDRKRLKEIIAEVVSRLRQDMVSSGHTTAALRALSYVSPINAAKELIEGIEYFKYLQKIDNDFDASYDKLVEDLRDVLGQILRRGALTVNCTSSKKPEEILTNAVTSLSKKLSTRLQFDNPKRPEVLLLNEGFKTASQVQYVATAGNFRDRGLEYNGSLNVLQVIFSYDYLWINVRVKGGAYGSMCTFSRSGNGYFTSYRDPNLMETYRIYKKAADYVSTFDADSRDMTKYIIGAISKLDEPLTPVAEGNYSYVAYMLGLTDEDIQKERDQVLATDVAAIRELAPYVEAIIDGGVICAIGGEGKLNAAKDNFKEVISVF